jgi:hypothetical protein
VEPSQYKRSSKPLPSSTRDTVRDLDFKFQIAPTLSESSLVGTKCESLWSACSNCQRNAACLFLEFQPTHGLLDKFRDNSPTRVFLSDSCRALYKDSYLSERLVRCLRFVGCFDACMLLILKNMVSSPHLFPRSPRYWAIAATRMRGSGKNN